MIVELDKTDLVRLARGVSPSYEHMDERYGQYFGGFKDEWRWDSYKLSKLSEDQLWALYQKLNEPAPKSGYYTLVDQQEEKRISEIREIELILADGIKRNNLSQIKAAEDELERLRNERF